MLYRARTGASLPEPCHIARAARQDGDWESERIWGIAYEGFPIFRSETLKYLPE